MKQLTSQIINPVLSPEIGSGGPQEAPSMLATLIVTLWQVIFVLGGLAVILFIASGALLWLTSGGDKGKVEAARERITAAIIGMAILFAMFALVYYIFPAIGFNILRPTLPDNLGL